MKFEEFLKWHGMITSKAMGGQTVDGEVEQFVRESNICINAYAVNMAGIEAHRKRLKDSLDTLCHLRDLTEKLKKEKK